MCWFQLLLQKMLLPLSWRAYAKEVFLGRLQLCQVEEILDFQSSEHLFYKLNFKFLAKNLNYIHSHQQYLTHMFIHFLTDTWYLQLLSFCQFTKWKITLWCEKFSLQFFLINIDSRYFLIFIDHSDLCL